MVAVGLSAAMAFQPPANCNGVWFKQFSGSSLFLGMGLSQTPGATMYMLGTSEVVTASGPARFFLYATGATSLVSVGLSFSRGMSSVVTGGG